MAINADNPGGGMRRTRRANPRGNPNRSISIGDEEVVGVSSRQSVRRSLTVGSLRYNDVTIFMRQLIMLLEAGTPLLKSLKTLSQRGQRAAARALVADIAAYVEMGNPLWQAFERHPRYFDSVFVNLVKASEASGTLIPVLQRMAAYRDKREILRKRLWAGMLYPAVLCVACFGVILLISMVIVPQFEDMFAKMNMQLGAFTVTFMAATKFIGSYWWLFIVGFIGLFVLYKLWCRTPVGRMIADRIKIRIPIIGNIVLKNALVEFSRTTSLLLKSGLSMMSTLDLVRNAIHNRAFAGTLDHMRESIERGGGLEEPMRAAKGLFPAVVTDMIVTGEESGRIDVVAEQIADTYEEEVNIAIAALGEALQPIMTVFLGGIVILLMLAVFLPLLQMVNTLGGGGAE